MYLSKFSDVSVATSAIDSNACPFNPVTVTLRFKIEPTEFITSATKSGNKNYFRESS